MPHPIADQYDDDEMEQLKRYGAAQLGGTQFSEEVEKHLRKLEANEKKMRAAQSGLAPEEVETQQAAQAGKLQQRAAVQGQQAAAQAQAQKASGQPPPPAPEGEEEA